MNLIRSHGIGYFVDKARSSNFEFNEFVSNADSYFHYSNQILFEISQITTALSLLFIMVSNSGTVLGILNISFLKSPPGHYPEFGVIVKNFEGVIERYCGVPP